MFVTRKTFEEACEYHKSKREENYSALKKMIERLREEIFDEKEERFYVWTGFGIEDKTEKRTPLETKLKLLERFLGIEYRNEERKIEGYKKINGKK